MSEQTIPTSVAELARQLGTPYGRQQFSPLGEHSFILLDTSEDRESHCAEALAICRQWLPGLPCPVIGIGPTSPLSACLDVSVPTLRQAQTMIANIRQRPLCAMTLVQLLRHNEGASTGDGLIAESLAYGTLQGGAEFQAYLANRKTLARATPEGDAILLQREGPTLGITLNRPQLRNAYSAAMRDRLVEALQLLAGDTSIERAVVRGAGACFCVGGDLAEFGLVSDPATAHAIRCSRHAGRLIHEHRDRIEFRVHRACIGAGIELPAFAHRVVASRDCIFQLPEISLGLVPGAGGTVSILQRIGRQRTAWLALSGKRIKAETALQWGLIDAIE